MEYIKEACVEKTGELCSFCNESKWTGPNMLRIPRPWPDHTQLPSYHYNHVQDTPIEEREPDDYQPRANLKRAFNNQSVTLDGAESISTFCDKYIVTEKVVREYLEHLQNLNRIKEIRVSDRQRGRVEKQNKQYDDYMSCMWDTLVEQGEIGTLLVSELDKYLHYHSLPTTGEKKDKMRRIIAHIYSNQERDIPDREFQYVSDEDESESEDDIEEVVAIDSAEDESDSEPEEEAQISRAETLTRSGRRSRIHRLDDYVY
jgi:hypothetical protein